MATSQPSTSRRGVSTTLTAEVFKDVIGALRSDDNSNRVLDKRSSPRVGLRTKLAIITGPAGPFERRRLRCGCATCRPAGWASSTAARWTRGTPFVAHLPRRQGPALRVLYEVAHCKRLAKDLYSIGAKLSRILP